MSETRCWFALAEYPTGGVDGIGRFDIYVNAVLLIFFEGFTSMLSILRFPLPVVTRSLYFGSYILALRLRDLVLRLPFYLAWQLLMMEFGIAALPWQLFLMDFGMCLFTWQFIICRSGI